jgi:hypothetical protein
VDCSWYSEWEAVSLDVVDGGGCTDFNRSFNLPFHIQAGGLATSPAIRDVD